MLFKPLLREKLCFGNGVGFGCGKSKSMERKNERAIMAAAKNNDATFFMV